MKQTEKLVIFPQLEQLRSALAAPPGAASAVFGVSSTACALLAVEASPPDKQILFVTETDAKAAAVAADLNTLGIGAAQYCSRDFCFFDAQSASPELSQIRLGALGQSVSKTARVICASIEAVCQPTMPLQVFKARSFLLKKGKPLNCDIARKLTECGYVRCDAVEGRGQFSVRGGIADVFACDAERPIRVDLFGDVPEALYEFDPATQRRIRSISQQYIIPAAEISVDDAAPLLELLHEKLPTKLQQIVQRDADNLQAGLAPGVPDRYMPVLWPHRFTLADYLPDAVLVLDSCAAIRDRFRAYNTNMADDITSIQESQLLTAKLGAYFLPEMPQLSSRPLMLAESFARDVGYTPLALIAAADCRVVPRWAGDTASLCADLDDNLSRGIKTAVLAGTPRAAKALARDLCEKGYSASTANELSFDSPVTVCPFTLSAGFSFEASKASVIASRREQQHQKRSFASTRRDARGIGSLEELKVGDYVVHIDHGIGIFEGIKTIDFHGNIKDYITIKYRAADMLYVPVTQLDMVALYTAPSDSKPPQLAKLNSGEWAKTKQSVYRGARDMAKELIQLYSQRSLQKGVSFSPDGEWQRDFETRFQYDETNDQLRSIAEIKADMEDQRPMDRLLCGDVGVGKTEVALRAAFKCVNDGYQCAVLVPTTILAWQHYHSFIARLENFPVKVAMLSRFSTPRQLREAVAGIKNGTVDIAVGTHRLLQKDIQFKKLGLLVIDEEQRFGVAHKEKLKQNFLGVDVLTLSATPIPRTLSMAMSGIRDMSVIDEPPQGRLPVQTYVMEYDSQRICDAIRRELARGGQVYYLHNRIDTIDSCAAELARLVPDARIETAHGRMTEEQLSGVWQRLIDGECDVLVCTTIIETGVDVPNCNTLIIENADNMGLAQLYQIRGRVGRSARRAYAYFTFRRDSVLTEIAAKRLSAIRDFTGFGSGFKIAMRDLQIRGAGSVLTARQSGHMQAVGYDMYIKILKEAVDDEKGIAAPTQTDCVVDLPIDAHIPESYIEDLSSRIEMYKKLAAVNSEQSAADVAEELADRFGPMPRCANDLLEVALMRTHASAIGIYEIKPGQNGQVLLYWDNIRLPAVRVLIKQTDREINLCEKGKSYVSVRPAAGEHCSSAVLDTLRILRAACEQSESGAAGKTAGKQ